MRRLMLAAVAAAVLVMAVPAAAQEGDVWRFYIVPKIGDGQTMATKFRAKYLDHDGFDVPYYAFDFGRDNAFLVKAFVTAVQHTAVAAQPDVIAFPLSIEDRLSPVALTTLSTVVEGLKVPANHFTTDHTVKDLISIVARMFGFAQKVDGIRARSLFDSGVTLDRQWGSLGATMKEALLAAAQAFGIDTSGLTGTMTLREILRDRWLPQMPPQILGGTVL